MAYVYRQVDSLEGTAKVGSGQCVLLVQRYAKAPATPLWREGGAVFGDFAIEKGTAIATFVGGKYESNRTGNHAAFYLSQDAGGIWVMDQWANNTTKPKVSKRYIRRKAAKTGGGFVDPSNNASAYFVIK